MSDPRPSLEPKQKLGLALQLIGITMLVINLYSAIKTGETTAWIIPVGLVLVIGGMALVIKKKVPK